MSVSGDIYYARLMGAYLGEQWNAYHWYRLDGDENFFDVTEVLATLLRFHWNALAQALSDEWVCYNIETMLYRDPTSEYYVDVADIEGQNVGQPVASFLVISFQSPSGAPSTRKGGKRVSGLVEEQVVGNTIPAKAEFDAFGLALGLGLGTGNAVLNPVIVKSEGRPPLGGGVNPTVTRTTLGLWSYKLGTQDSRKPGSGA